MSKYADLPALRSDWEHTINGEGAHCPVCDRWGKKNEFKLNILLTKTLVTLYNEGVHQPERWINMPVYRNMLIHRSHQYSKLRYWGLLEANPKKEGLWRVTPLGELFLMEKTTVPASVWVYNNNVVGVSTSEITLKGAFKETFDYESTMQSTWDYWKSQGGISEV